MEPEPPQRSRRRGVVALVFALAAAAACWNVIAAPLGLVVGLAATVLSVRALRRSPPPRRVPLVSLVVAVVASLTSAIVIGLTAGAVGIELPGEPVVKGRTQAELDEVLSQAAERTRVKRERARRELDAAGGAARDAGRP